MNFSGGTVRRWGRGICRLKRARAEVTGAVVVGDESGVFPAVEEVEVVEGVVVGVEEADVGGEGGMLRTSLPSGSLRRRLVMEAPLNQPMEMLSAWTVPAMRLLIWARTMHQCRNR